MATIWELDFYSRPLLDEQNKKVWEVLVCESPLKVDSDVDGLFRYAEYCPNSQVNSIWLKAAIEQAIAKAPAPPDKIRFFRQAMTNMITKSCEDLEIPAQLSRRTYTLNNWLRHRMEEVYPQMPGFQPGTNPTVSFAVTAPQSLPDALRGERWQFVSLDAGTFSDMSEWAIDFGEAFPLSLAKLAPETPVPGLIIYSTRALPLAGWMSGLELACISFDPESNRLLLETGIQDRWALANLSTVALQTEAQQFEAAKQSARGVHFLAIQTDPNSDSFAGFWLMQESPSS